MDFLHVFRYQLKNLLGKRWLIGWNFVFPLVLSTAFYFGFGNMIKNDPNSFEIIPVGYYVEQTDSDDSFAVFLDALSDKNSDTQYLTVTNYQDKSSAEDALKEGKITGYYINTNGKISLRVAESNTVRTTTLNQLMKSYVSSSTMVNRIMKEHPEKLQDVMTSLADSQKSMAKTSDSKKNTSAKSSRSIDSSYLTRHVFGKDYSQFMQYFLSLLAMSSLFASWISTTMMEPLCANVSECGKRFEVAPVHKLSAILAGTLAGTILQFLANCIVVIYIQFGLGIHFGVPLITVFGILALGSAVGIASGVLIGSICKKQVTRILMPLIYTMVCSFLSGLMVGFIKQLIEDTVPIVNRLNPAAVLTDSLYVLANYGRTQRYVTDIITMIIMIVIPLLISGIILGRRNYASI